MKKMNQKGFTLAELLIVVAIIAVLVAIAIPVFTNQLEKSREATDIANIRAAYAEAVVTQLDSDNGTGTATSVAMVQTNSGWEYLDDLKVGGQTPPGVNKGKTVTVNVSNSGTVSFTVN